MRFKSVFAASAVFFALTAATASQAADQTLGMAIMSATVNEDGSLVTGAGVVSSAFDSGPKWYTVKFNRPLAGCASVVTSRFKTAVAMTYDQSGPDDPLYILLTDYAGNNVARSFHLIVFCPK